MTLSTSENMAALVVLNRAISLRQRSSFLTLSQAVKNAGLAQNEAYARLLMAHLSEEDPEDFQRECERVVSRLPNWRDLCGELIRYSNGTLESVKTFFAILANTEPNHPILQKLIGKSIFKVDQAYDSTDCEGDLKVRVNTPLQWTDDLTLGLISLDDPVGSFFISTHSIYQDDYIRMRIEDNEDITSDRTFVIRPCVLFIAR